ncbi:venom carboxylesterase-6-like [Spodoptera litura]|uniref:Venom carboxylesterase-6-like n=1 Tax=Spodoptera litura TaxID=69820 RepID=A0A9J7E659_SPOLT|nr:venom carboxylesterase-6-like [Spodoptera litura]
MCSTVLPTTIKMVDIPEEAKCIVQTADGPICGYCEKTDEGICYKFKSIPYAKPPLGHLRFLPPSPIPPWTEVLDCTKDAPNPVCRSVYDIISGSEDCLYIELSTPSIKPDKPIPVMFWIGGYGYSCVLDPILDATLFNYQNVIFVRCGHRTGPFGYLSINDYAAPGNCGLKDVVMALKWVQRNISTVGGDPNNVTIFGSSSGGAMVNFMMLSPMATGLFHKLIIQSASVLNNWSLAKNPSQGVIELAKILGIEKTSKQEIVEELRRIPAVDIAEAFKNFHIGFSEGVESDLFDSVFKPCIEVDLEGQAAFITKSPIVILKSGNFNKVPCIIGSNNIEGAVLQYVVENFCSNFEKYNENIKLLVPRELARRDRMSDNIGHQILKFYLDGEEHLSEKNRTQYLQLISDYYFSYYVNKTVKLLCEFAPSYPVYYYILNYAGEWAVPEKFNFFNSTGHGAELPFLFRIKMPDVCKGSPDSITTRTRVIKMWTNFAKTGNPTPDPDDPLLWITWDPVESKEKLNYLSIGQELTKGRNPFQERMKFWDKLHKEHMFLRALVHFNDSGYSV